MEILLILIALCFLVAWLTSKNCKHDWYYIKTSEERHVCSNDNIKVYTYRTYICKKCKESKREYV